MILSNKIKNQLSNQQIEVPSWAYGNSGTRFRVFGSPGTPRNIFEKISDAAIVNKLTGLAGSVALHYPWDKVENWRDLQKHATDSGIKLGTINSNTFQDEEYKFGSLCHSDKKIRRKAIDHHLECIEIMNILGVKDIKIWLADGSNYPGQSDMRSRQDFLSNSLQEIYSHIGDNQRLLLEYKFFEPAFYHTDVPDWGTSYAQTLALGERAKVVLDTGHHAPGTNIEFIVMQLCRLGKLGAFDFNSRFYADDDLIVGAADPFQLFRIMYEVIRNDALNPENEVSFVLDQCHNVEEKIPAQIRSVLNVQELSAKALLINRNILSEAQNNNDVLGAHEIFMNAFYTDVREELAEWRRERGFAYNPVEEFKKSGYQQNINISRNSGAQSNWGA